MKELIKKLNEGCCYYDSHHISCLVDEVKTNEVMNQAARAIEELSKKREHLSDRDISHHFRINTKALELDSYFQGFKDSEKAHGIGVSDE